MKRKYKKKWRVLEIEGLINNNTFIIAAQRYLILRNKYGRLIPKNILIKG